jgi:hypothetical protein
VRIEQFYRTSAKLGKSWTVAKPLFLKQVKSITEQPARLLLEL